MNSNQYLNIFLGDKNIDNQITKRNRQLTSIDNKINTIGRNLNLVMLSEEIKTGKLNLTAQKQHLFKIIKILNKNKKKPVDFEKLDVNPNDSGIILKK